jgi:3-hydroxyisobutyrate dehydrogenase
MRANMVATIAVLGTGAMGTRVVRNLLEAGHMVTVYNRSPERVKALQNLGAMVAATPRAAAEGVAVVMSMVRDDEASRAVWLHEETGAINSLATGAVAIESSTLTPGWVRTLAERVHGRGAAFLDAPMLGTRPQAEAKQLIYLVGGAAGDLERVAPLLAATSSATHHLGEVGAGATMKLAANTLYGVQVAIWAETLALLDAQGIAVADAVQVLNTLPTTSPALQGVGTLMAAGSYAPMFPIELVSKDFGYALAIARALGAATPTLAAVEAIYAEAAARGYGDDNIAGIKQLFDALNRERSTLAV